jgi:hypothetical protein
MSVRIKAVVDRFVKELQEALDADIQDRIMKEREMQSYIEEREREVAEREAAWKAELSRREVNAPAISEQLVCATPDGVLLLALMDWLMLRVADCPMLIYFHLLLISARNSSLITQCFNCNRKSDDPLK